jgi:Fic family protein/HAMP domain-containing protein
MPRIVTKQWIFDDGTHNRKGEVIARDYDAYVPDLLMGRQFVFTGECAAAIAEAETAVRSLHSNAAVLDRTDGVARLLLRAEAQASSRIEGVVIGAQRLLQAEAARDIDSAGKTDSVADEVLANIDAMDVAMELADMEREVTIDTFLRIHRRVLQASDLKEFAGQLRGGQSWIGGALDHPCDSKFVPPPPEEVPALLEDLAAFCNDTSLPAVAQAAIVHAQFETIHPFVDGNGRTGRAILHVMLRRRGLAPSWCPPVSLVLETFREEYLCTLDAYHSKAPADSPETAACIDSWVSFFAKTCTRSVQDAQLFEERVAALGPISAIGWAVVVGRSKEAVMAPIISQLMPLAGLFLLITAAVFLIAFTLSGRIAGSIRKLWEHALAIGGGDLEKRVEPHGIGELKDLASAFNTMAEKIGVREKALEAAQKRLVLVLEAIPASVYLQAPDYSIRFANIN